MTTTEKTPLQTYLDSLNLGFHATCTNPGKADIGRLQKGESSQWVITIERNGKSIQTTYTMGCGLREYGLGKRAKRIPQTWGNIDSKTVTILRESRPQAPTLADVLYSLQSDASLGNETFDEFCGNLGYDTDSRKALESYLACQNTAVQLRSLGLNLAELAEQFQDF